MLTTLRLSEAVMMGVIRPRGDATATAMSANGCSTTLPSVPYVELRAGTARKALAAALMMTSLRENLAPVASVPPKTKEKS